MSMSSGWKTSFTSFLALINLMEYQGYSESSFGLYNYTSFNSDTESIFYLSVILDAYLEALLNWFEITDILLGNL